MKSREEEFQDALKLVLECLSQKQILDKSGNVVHEFLLSSYGPQSIWRNDDGEIRENHGKLELKTRDMVVVLRAERDAAVKKHENAQADLEYASKKRAEAYKKVEELNDKLARINGL